jgi:hypothetical protein
MRSSRSAPTSPLHGSERSRRRSPSACTWVRRLDEPEMTTLEGLVRGDGTRSRRRHGTADRSDARRSRRLVRASAGERGGTRSGAVVRGRPRADRGGDLPGHRRRPAADAAPSDRPIARGRSVDSARRLRISPAARTSGIRRRSTHSATRSNAPRNGDVPRRRSRSWMRW